MNLSKPLDPSKVKLLAEQLVLIPFVVWMFLTHHPMFALGGTLLYVLYWGYKALKGERVKNKTQGVFDIVHPMGEQEFIDYMFSKYPQMFRRATTDDPIEYGTWDVSIPRGWRHIVVDLTEKLTKHYTTYYDGETLEGFYLNQVKEKFGGLRFYTTYLDEEASDILCAAEDEARNTCQECGTTAGVKTISRIGWISTLCVLCQGDQNDEDHLHI